MVAGDRTVEPAADEIVETDPRRVRSRNRLLDAAAGLLSSGGVEAVTVDAVTRVSQVARTTLYRHFESTTDLVAAAFERLLPMMEPPARQPSLREDLVELLRRQAEQFDHAPLQLTTLAWLAMSPDDTPDHPNRLAPLRFRVASQYRVPFDAVLDTDEARELLGDFELDLAIIQLVGPLIFAKLSGLVTVTAANREQIVDDFLRARGVTD